MKRKSDKNHDELHLQVTPKKRVPVVLRELNREVVVNILEKIKFEKISTGWTAELMLNICEVGLISALQRMSSI